VPWLCEAGDYPRLRYGTVTKIGLRSSVLVLVQSDLFLHLHVLGVGVKFTVERATKAQRGRRGIALLFL